MLDFSVNSFHCPEKVVCVSYERLNIKGVSGEIAGTEGFGSSHNYMKAWQSKILTKKNCFLNLRSVSFPNSIREEAEFEGDPTLELISDEKAQEMERPAWAQKILSAVQPKG